MLAYLISLPELGRISDGNLSSSTWFGTLKLTAPFILLQSFFAVASIAATAFYGFLGKFERLRVTKSQTNSCDDSTCAACVRAYPEPHVLTPVISQHAQPVTEPGDLRVWTHANDALPMKLDLRSKKSFEGINVNYRA